MAFAVGDQVLVVALNRRGEIVEPRGQAWRVVVGGLTVTCRPGDLRAITSASRTRRAPASSPAPAGASRPMPPRSPAGDSRTTIDLHGLTTLEAREALLRHVDAALRAGHALVEVVHGIGTGKVRAAVIESTKSIPSVRKVQPHPTNRGVTLLYL